MSEVISIRGARTGSISIPTIPERSSMGWGASGVLWNSADIEFQRPASTHDTGITIF